MKGLLVVDCDFVSRLDVPQSNEQNAAVKNLHIGAGLARMINIVRAVSTTAAVQAPAIIDSADAQPSSARPAIGLSVGNLLARVLRDFPAAAAVSYGKAALAFDS